MKKIMIEAPWYTYQKKVKALFDRDPDIIVGDVYEPGDGSADVAFDIEVRSHDKFMALDRVLVKHREFGNISLSIVLFDEENAKGEDDYIALYKTIFKDNTILSDVKEAADFTGTRLGYVLFQPEVIQFLDDDTSDYYGNWNGLAEDIAREIFVEGYRGITFCTEAVNGEG